MAGINFKQHRDDKSKDLDIDMIKLAFLTDLRNNEYQDHITPQNRSIKKSGKHYESSPYMTPSGDRHKESSEKSVPVAAKNLRMDSSKEEIIGRDS